MKRVCILCGEPLPRKKTVKFFCSSKCASRFNGNNILAITNRYWETAEGDKIYLVIKKKDSSVTIKLSYSEILDNDNIKLIFAGDSVTASYLTYILRLDERVFNLRINKTKSFEEEVSDLINYLNKRIKDLITKDLESICQNLDNNIRKQMEDYKWEGECKSKILKKFGLKMD